MNSPPVPFTQLIGQTEKALNVMLGRLLAGTVSEPQWVTLVLTGRSVGSADRDQLAVHVARALKVDTETAAHHIAQLTAKGLVGAAAEHGADVTLTEAGRQFMDRVQKQVDQITQRLWGDLPARDVEAASRVLSTILHRADAELTSGS